MRDFIIPNGTRVLSRVPLDMPEVELLSPDYYGKEYFVVEVGKSIYRMYYGNIYRCRSVSEPNFGISFFDCELEIVRPEVVVPEGGDWE